MVKMGLKYKGKDLRLEVKTPAKAIHLQLWPVWKDSPPVENPVILPETDPKEIAGERASNSTEAYFK